MGFFDSLVGSMEKQAKQNERKARAEYGRKLYSAYSNTDDPVKKSELAKKYKENGDALRNLK